MASTKKQPVDGYAGQRKPMPCLKCGKAFMTHPGKRICSKCTIENGRLSWPKCVDPTRSTSGRRLTHPHLGE